ncbi:MAG: ImmA/IrrE family metallo-endopeptidase [Burkholderiales bacterium]
MLTTSHRIAKFCEYWGSRSKRRDEPPFLPARLRAAQCAIERAFPDLDALSTPIDVEALARRRDIRGIEYREVGGDGQISRLPGGGYVVTVNRAHSEQRRRFTIAHEIAHTLFFEALGEESEQLGMEYEEGRDPDEERICDFVAARLLLPPKQVERFLKQHSIDVSTVVSLAHEFDCSLRAAARCFLQHFPLKARVIFWEYLEKRGMFVARWLEATEESGRAGRLRFDLRANEPAYTDFLERRQLWGRYWIRLDGPLDRYFVDGIAFRSTPRRLLTLIVLDEAAEMIVRSRLPTNSGDALQASLF